MEMNKFMTNKEKAAIDYISRWSLNAKQHFDDGDYEWLCEFIKSQVKSNIAIAEVGCGAGYSTLAFVKNNFDIVAVDVNVQALESTYNLLQENKLEDRAVMAHGDIVHHREEMAAFLKANSFPTNIIVLCNPGGNVNVAISKTEYALLRQFGFSEEEINNNQVDLLHKWALIYATCLLSTTTDRMLIIVERGTKEELDIELEQIESETGVRKKAVNFRKIRCAPQGGVPLGMTDTEQYWGVALYYPR